MSISMIMDAINRRTMSGVTQAYRWSDDLQAAERAALSTILDEVRGQRVLDLGVGAGRTVKPLVAISRRYIGVDYVEEMVAHCRERFPDVRFEQGDARSLPQFSDHSFELIVFSCNGICMVGHQSRLRILAEVLRLLVPGGYFLFSTSNRNDPTHGRLMLPEFSLTWHPIRLGVRCARFGTQTGLRLLNRWRYARHEVRTTEYAILNDRSHDHGTMNYFITLEQQHRQLERIGFAPRPLVFDLSGSRVDTDTQDGTLTILARKPIHAPA